VFGEVLALCAEAGLVNADVVAVDGTKVHANASERATCDYEQIAREVLAEADAVDAEEDERFGDRRGDELPEPKGAALGTRGRFRRRGRRGCATPSVVWKKSTASKCRPTPSTRPIGRMASISAAGSSVVRRSRSLHRPRRRARSTPPTRTRGTSRRRGGGCRATTPRRSRPTGRS
jgi:hypothetical protein